MNEAAGRRGCDCGERQHLEDELQKNRDLVGKLDASAGGLDEDLRDCRAERAELIDNLRDAAEWIENATIGTQHMVPKVAKRARALLQKLDGRTE